jgi:iron complex outermembrane recepter protein
MMKKIMIALAAFAALTGLPALSQQADDSIRSISLKEVVITSSKIERMAGLSTQVIDIVRAEDITGMVSGNRNISEAIQYKPGAAVSALSRNDANWGTYGGIGPKYSTYMLNGLPIDAFVDPMALDLNAVSRIEVQRGPASVLYSNYLSQDFAGNQTPLAGTVNLVLKERISAPMLQYGMDYGSYNTLRNQVYAQNSAGRLHFFAGASYETSDYTDYGTEGSWLNMTDDPQYRKSKFFGGATVFAGASEQHKISVFMNHTRHHGNAGRPNRGYEHQYDHMNAAYSGKLSSKAEIMFKLGFRSYGRSWQEDNYSNGQDFQIVSNDGVRQTIIPADLSVFFRHGNNHLLTAGADMQHASYYTYNNPINNDKVDMNDAVSQQAGLYVQEELVFGKFTLRGGGRANYTTYSIEKLGGQIPGNSEQNWIKLLWSGGAKYRIFENLSLFVNAGNSFMAPGLKSIGGTIPLSELGVAGVHGQLPNPSLHPESGLGFDIGASWMLEGKLDIGLRGFYNAVNDAIVENVVSNDPSQTQSVNAGKANAAGGELSVRYAMGRHLECFGNYTYMNTQVGNPHDADQDGGTIPFAPSTMVNAGITARLPLHFRINLYLHYSDYYYDSPSKSGRSSIPGHELLNASASKMFFLDTTRTIELFMSFYNISDNRCKLPWQFQDPGFSFSGGIKVTL